MFFRLAILFSRGPSGDNGGSFKEVVIKSAFVFWIELTGVSSLGEGRIVLVASKFLKISNVGHDNFIQEVFI